MLCQGVEQIGYLPYQRLQDIYLLCFLCCIG